MLDHYFFFDDPLFVNTVTQLYASVPSVDYSLYDYIITLDSSFNYLFNVKTYKQNSLNPSDVDISFNISINDYNNMYKNTNMQQTQSNAYMYGSVDKIDFGTRILEILALKIFGHARARAAINNDVTIVNNLQDDLYNHLENVVQKHKYDIFNMYVSQDLPELNQDDISEPVNFNFNYDKIMFPGFVKGSLSNKNLLSPSLLNGPTHGINSVVNGDYNIPILIVFSDNGAYNQDPPPPPPPNNLDYIIILMTYDDNGYVTYIAFDAKSIYQ